MKAIAFIFYLSTITTYCDSEVVFNLDFSHKLMILGINFSHIWIFFRWLLSIDDLNLIIENIIIAFFMIEVFSESKKMFQSWQKIFWCWVVDRRIFWRIFCTLTQKRDEREAASSYVPERVQLRVAHWLKCGVREL